MTAIEKLIEIVETENAKIALQCALNGQVFTFKEAMQIKPFVGGPFLRSSYFYKMEQLFKKALMGQNIEQHSAAISKKTTIKFKAVRSWTPQPLKLK